MSYLVPILCALAVIAIVVFVAYVLNSAGEVVFYEYLGFLGQNIRAAVSNCLQCCPCCPTNRPEQEHQPEPEEIALEVFEGNQLFQQPDILIDLA